ncbi:MAG: BMC domain-containing protein [Clostridiales bacterium]|nr:BMC domain-containing protein [Clostridiales bacterium]
MRKSIGMVETRSLVGAIQAADAMTKSADVKIINFTVVGSGIVSVIVEGDVAAVQSAVGNGVLEAEKISEIISYNVIPNPNSEVDKMIL